MRLPISFLDIFINTPGVEESCSSPISHLASGSPLFPGAQGKNPQSPSWTPCFSMHVLSPHADPLCSTFKIDPGFKGFPPTPTAALLQPALRYPSLYPSSCQRTFSRCRRAVVEPKSGPRRSCSTLHGTVKIRVLLAHPGLMVGPCTCQAQPRHAPHSRLSSPDRLLVR